MKAWVLAVESHGVEQLVRVPVGTAMVRTPYVLEGEHYGIRVRTGKSTQVLKTGDQIWVDGVRLHCKSSTSSVHVMESNLLAGLLSAGSVPLEAANAIEVHTFIHHYHLETKHFPIGPVDGIVDADGSRLKVGKTIFDGSPVRISQADGSQMMVLAVKLPDPMFAGTEKLKWREVAFILFSIGVLVAWFLLVQNLGEVVSDKEVDIEKVPDRFTKIQKRPDSGYSFESLKRLGDRGGAGARRAGEEGKRGSPTATDDAALARARAERRAATAKSAGVLSVLGGSGLFKGAKGSTQGTEGRSLDELAGGIAGESFGNQKGVGGFGLKGTGPGGGGTSAEGVGLGQFGKGRGLSGTGTGTIEGGGIGELSLPPLEETELIGALDKDVIRAVIARYLPQIRACYEKGLTRQKDLAGKIRTHFVISGSGTVASASVIQSTLGDEDVHQCITRAMMTWIFPQPQGNGIVKVTYPFLFKPTG